MLPRGREESKSLLLCSEAGGPVTGDDAMDWITPAVLAVMGLASVTVHAMTGGSVVVGCAGTPPRAR
jgi:hypothetical protein